VFGSETAQGFDSFGAPFVLSALVFQESVDGCVDDHPFFWSDIPRPYLQRGQSGFRLYTFSARRRCGEERKPVRL